MNYSKVITPATTLAVSLEEFKVALRQDNTAEDTFLESLLQAAITQAEDYLQISLNDQVREVRIKGTPLDAVSLDMGPVLSIEEVTYTDTAGTEQTIDPADYVLVGDTLYPVDGWPSVGTQEGGAFVVQYRAGLVDDSVSPVGQVPARIRAAVMLMGQILYDRHPASADLLLKTAHGLLDTARVGQGV